MKKRILGMLLCLVMVVSLLPITAAADTLTVNFVSLTATSVNVDTRTVNDLTAVFTSEGQALSSLGYNLEYKLYYDDGDGALCLKCWIYPKDWDYDTSRVPECTFSVPGYTTELRDAYFSSSTKCLVVTFVLTEGHEHDWQFTTTENSLTATCQNPGCPIGTVGVTLTAHSVTLPESPFNAKVEVTGAFKEAFPGAEISDIRYDYEDSEGAWHYDIDPIPANAKAGQYQAGVCVSGLSGNPGAALMALSTDDGINQGGQSVYLFVKYTAADPAVTAQTGDSRPIELMMAGVVAFSVLAVAAFILDSKRKYSR